MTIIVPAATAGGNLQAIDGGEAVAPTPRAAASERAPSPPPLHSLAPGGWASPLNIAGAGYDTSVAGERK